MSKVLIVEDSRTQALQVRLLLERAGFEAAIAGDGRGALDLLGRDLPDVVLSDVQMPQMNGLELVEAVRQEHAGLPVVIMTAMGSEELAVQALHAGAASYVPKRNLPHALIPTLDAKGCENRTPLPIEDRNDSMNSKGGQHAPATDCLGVVSLPASHRRGENPQRDTGQHRRPDPLPELSVAAAALWRRPRRQAGDALVPAGRHGVRQRPSPPPVPRAALTRRGPSRRCPPTRGSGGPPRRRPPRACSARRASPPAGPRRSSVPPRSR
jgi:CheY-like chemotaxis protein